MTGHEDVLAFPSGFLWGAATSAYQIEGSPRLDGKGESIWDRFAHEKGRVAGGHNGDTACDSYRRWREDVELVAGLGLGAYRFSISWPRLIPGGHGPVEARGVAHYDRFIDALLDRGVEPVVTLYHWDLPQALQDTGGWASRDTAERFGEYAALCSERYGDRVRWWITQNEPWIAAMLGYERGIHAPGWRDVRAAVRASHHLLLSHGRAAAALEANAPGARIGLAHSLAPHVPATHAPRDAGAAWDSDGYVNRWYLDPLLRGRYPDDGLARYEAVAGPLDFIHPGDLAAIGRRCDFLGINYYTRRRVAAAPGRSPWPWKVESAERGIPTTDSGWEIVPGCLTDHLLRLEDGYGRIPVLITENGGMFGDEPGPDGQVHDTRRIQFIHDHLVAVGEAIARGVPVAGYFHWSLMDNFEWALGYGHRFGLVHVDHRTQCRTIKDSARYYAGVAAANGVTPVPAATAP